MTKQPTLEQTIVAALSDDNASAAALADLIATTESGIVEADAAFAAAQQALADPVQTPDIRAGQARVEAVEFVADRLRSLLPRLEDRYRELANAEARAEWSAKVAALERERDQLADELRATYQPATTKIADVLGRAADLDHRLSELHQSRPSGCKGILLGVELVARGLDSDSFTRDTPSLTKELRIPDWQDSAKLLWPPHETPASVLLADSIAAAHDDPRRHSADWHEVLAEETAARQAEEAKRIEAEAAHTAQEKRNYEEWLTRMSR